MDNTKERADAFKVGFLFKLAQAGIAPRELYEKVKSASALDSVLSGAVDVGKAALPAAGSLGLSGLQTLAMAGVAGPVLAGGALGAAQSSLEAPTAKDIDVLRQAELAGLYTRLAAEIRARNSVRDGGRR